MEIIIPVVIVVAIIALICQHAPWIWFVAGAGIIALIVVTIVKTQKARAFQRKLQNEYTVDYNIYTKLAGVTFNGIQNILPKLRSGMSVEFRREPRNAYDENAVKAICDGKMIGYLSADLACDIAPLMDKGIPVIGSIRAITGGDMGRSYGCNVDVVVYKRKDEKSASSEPATKISELTCQVEQIDESNPLYMKQCAVFGSNKVVAAQSIINLGGIVKSQVNNDTDYVIALTPDWLNGRGANAARAKEIISKGGKLKVINSREFKAIKDKYLSK